jgi:hypothetical protein
MTDKNLDRIIEEAEKKEIEHRKNSEQFYTEKNYKDALYELGMAHGISNILQSLKFWR